MMSEVTLVDVNFIRQIARANGLDLALDRAEALLPALRELLTVDAQIAKLPLRTIPAIGPPWAPGEPADDE